MIKKIFIIISLLIFSINSGYTQYWKLVRYEALFGLGTTNLFGDIGGTKDKNNLWGFKDIKMKETGPSFYFGGRYKIKENQAFKLNLTYGHAVSNDIDSKNETREFSYKTSIIETSVLYEYYFLSDNRKLKTYRLYNRKGMVNNFSTISFYGFIGLGGIYFKPKLSYNGRLPDPSIEQTSGYSNYSVVFPIGFGTKMALNKLWSIGFEFGRRFALTDYIDGISTDYSDNFDTYYYSSLHLIYKIESDRYGRPKFIVKKRYSRY